MSRLQQRLLIFVLLLLIAFWVGINRGRVSKEEPFLGYLSARVDYVPPSYPLTLYPTNGPYGISMVSALAAGEGGLLFAGTYGAGLYKSEDGGESWSYAGKGLGDKFIVSLSMTDQGVVYAGTIRAGLYKSMDRGASWIPLSEGLGPAEVRALLPVSEDEFYVGTEQGIFRSRDGGEHWESIHQGLQPVLVRTIVKGQGDRLFIGTQGSGIFRAESPTGAWTAIGETLYYEPGVRETVIRVLLRDRENALYAGTLGSGVFKSLDQGETWEAVKRGLENLSIRTLLIGPGSVLYAGTGGGVFESRDRGGQWEAVSEGLGNLPVESMALDPGGRLYVGTSQGIFVRQPKGGPWRYLSEAFLQPPVKALSVDDAAERGWLYADVPGRGVLKSEDGGKTWTPQMRGPSGLLPLASTPAGEGGVYIATESGLYLKRPRQPPEAMGDGHPPGIISIGRARGTIWAGTRNGLYLRREGNRQWRKIDPLDGKAVRQIQVTPEGVYVRTDREIWFGTDDGIMKDLAWPFPEPPLHVADGPQNRLAAVGRRGLFLREAGTWRSAGEVPDPEAGLLTVQFDRDDPKILFVGGDRGLFWTTDGGRHWQGALQSDGSPFDAKVNALVRHPSGVLFVATETEGVHVLFDQIQRPGWIGRWLNR